MKRNAKIIKISGIKGLIISLFIITCLAAGFIAFPGFVAMNIWNHFAGLNFPQLNLYQGVLLWAIIAISCFIASKQKVVVSFGTPQELNDEELNGLMQRIKAQSEARKINNMIIQNLEEIKKEEISEENISEDKISKK